jgi:hypothetical protein
MGETAVKLGEEYIFDNEIHYVTQIKEDVVVLKTFTEVYAESACRGCKFFIKSKGWFKRERIKFNDSMPHAFMCKLGQYELTHKVTVLPQVCVLKNFKYEYQKEVKKYIKSLLQNVPNAGLVAQMIIPLGEHLGMNVVNVKDETVRFVHKAVDTEI